MNAHVNFAPARITPAMATEFATHAATDLIERYRDGLTRVIAFGRDQFICEEARQCLELVERWERAMKRGQMFAADNALIWLGDNMAGPRIEAAIVAGERRSDARPLPDRILTED